MLCTYDVITDVAPVLSEAGDQQLNYILEMITSIAFKQPIY